MTKKELSINIKWDEFEMGTCRLFVPILNQYIPTVFFQDHKPKPTVSNKMLKSINDILDMDMHEFDRIEKILSSKDLILGKIKEIHVDQDNDVYEGVYSEVIIDTGSNTQVSIIVKNGEFLCINDGKYFDTLEVSEQKTEVNTISKESREKIISMMLSSE